jgi:phage terminase small subunit
MEKIDEKQQKEKKITKKVKKFMKSVDEFLKSKNNGKVPPEWGCSLTLLEEYFKQFIYLTEEINSLESMVIDGRYGPQPTPLLLARDKAAMRLEAMMKELGLTFKSAAKLDIIEPVAEESPLEKYAKNKIEKR